MKILNNINKIHFNKNIKYGIIIIKLFMIFFILNLCNFQQHLDDLYYYLGTFNI